jgi:hypothetical protein
VGEPGLDPLVEQFDSFPGLDEGHAVDAIQIVFEETAGVPLMIGAGVG